MINKLSGDFLQWMRGFYFVVKFGGVSKAARHMGLIQSAVSHQIKNLEKELNVELFQRGHKEMVLTPEGRRLFGKSIPLFERVQEILEEVGRKEGELGGAVRIATTHAVGLHFLPEYVRNFMMRHPKVRFELTGGGFASIVDMVEHAQADLGIVNQFDFPESIEHRILFNTRLMLAGPIGNPFGLPKRCTLEEASRLPFISFPAHGTVETTLGHILKERGITFRKVMWANNFALLIKYVEMGLGVTILDEFALLDQAQTVELHSLEDGLPPRRYGVITRKGQYLAPQVHAFLRSFSGL